MEIRTPPFSLGAILFLIAAMLAIASIGIYLIGRNPTIVDGIGATIFVLLIHVGNS
jgi:hypothetical protein